MSNFSTDLKQIANIAAKKPAAAATDTTTTITTGSGTRHLLDKGGTQYAAQYGAVRRSRAHLRSHSLICGDIGSGKNLIGDPYIASLLINRTGEDRFVFEDPKGTTQQLLGGLGVPYTLVSIDDERGVALDITKDCTSPVVMLGYAKALFPDKKGGGDTFWPAFAQSIAIGIKNGMVDINYRAPFLATLVRVLREISYFATEKKEGKKTTLSPTAFYKTVLSHSPLNRMLSEVLNSSETIEAGVLGEILASIERLTPAAAHDAKATQRLSISEFINRKAFDQDGAPIRVLVLNMDIRSRKASEAYMRLAFRMLVDNILALPDCVNDPDHPKIFIYLDELPFISSTGLPGFQDLVSVGRSKGLHILAIIQSVSQITEVFGKDTGLAILNSLPDKIFTATTASDNGQAFENACGKQYQKKTHANPSFSRSGVSYQIADREELKTLHPSGELLSLPFPTKQDGLSFFHIDPDFKHENGPIRGNWSGQMVEELKPPYLKTIPGLISRSPSYYYLPPLPEFEREWLAHGIAERFYSQVIQNLKSGSALQDENGARSTLLSDQIKEVIAIEGTEKQQQQEEGSNLSFMHSDALEVVTASYQQLIDAYMLGHYGTRGY